MSLKIDRRQVLQAGGASALALGMGLAPMPARAEPKQGGDLKVAIGHGSTSDSLDPATYENDSTISMSHQLFNFLTEIAPDNSLAGELAESWEATPDAKTWTFQLRPDVTFHNGKTMTADDVIASINHHRGEDSTSAAKVLVDPITDIRKDGDNVVIFELSGGNADFPYLMSDYHLAVMPSEDGAIDPTSGIGTGPLSLETFDPGVRYATKRNPNYWKEGRGHFDSIEVLTVNDPAARMNAIVTGEVHLIGDPDLKTINLLQRGGNITVETTTGNQHYTMPMMVTQAPFDNADVRNALKWAINRQQIVDTILQGYGKVGNDTPIGFANRYQATTEELPQREFDPDRAKSYLQKAGLDSLQVTIHPSDAAFAGAVDAAVLFSESARQAGIQLDVVREPEDGYWSNVWMVKPWSTSYYGGRPTEDWMFSVAYESTAAWNETFWDNERFDTLLRQARAELDENLRRQMYVEMQQILHNEGGQIVPMFADFVFARTNDLAHEDPMAANWNMDGHRYCERWWFNS